MYLQLVSVEKFEGTGSTASPHASSCWQVMNFHRELFQLWHTTTQLGNKSWHGCRIPTWRLATESWVQLQTNYTTVKYKKLVTNLTHNSACRLAKTAKQKHAVHLECKVSFLGVGWDCVHLVHHPLFGVLYKPQTVSRWRWVWSSQWNENWQGKLRYLEKICPSATLLIMNITWPGLGLNLDCCGRKLVAWTLAQRWGLSSSQEITI
jgi:hypothetical protein